MSKWPTWFAIVQVGSLIWGKVRRVEIYGAFIGIDDTYVSGLLHVTNTSNMHVDNMFVSIGLAHHRMSSAFRNLEFERAVFQRTTKPGMQPQAGQSWCNSPSPLHCLPPIIIPEGVRLI